jgi:very-short-patch-repair endonuclease
MSANEPRSSRSTRAAERVAVEERIDAIAARQHGVITGAQLRAAGLGPHAVKYRLAGKRLHLVQRGVYRVGPLLTRRGQQLAAALACGAGAVLSHRSAAALWRIIPEADAPIEVTSRGANRHRRPGIRPHRGRLGDDDVACVDGIPVTSVARTLLDLAGTAPPGELDQALARAERLGLANPAEVESLLARHPKARGARVLRALLGVRGGVPLTRSEAEKRFLQLTRKAQLPAPRTNSRVVGHEVDVLWPAERLVVEIDGVAFHSSPASFEQDRSRDAQLAAAGFQVVRVTWRQMVREPEAVIARVAQALALRARPKA